MIPHAFVETTCMDLGCGNGFEPPGLWVANVTGKPITVGIAVFPGFREFLAEQ